MSRILLLTSAVCAMSAAALFTPAQASPVSGLTSSPLTAQSLIGKAGYRYCWHRNRICRARWIAGWRYRRCMVLHGC